MPLEERIRKLEKEQSEPKLISIISGIGWIIAIFALLYLIKKREHGAS
jgi:hypothetical protein